MSVSRPLRRSALALALAAFAATASAAQRYDIPAGPLGDALSQFAAASGVMLSFDSRITAALSSQALQGEYEVEQGFARLLAGSGLAVQALGDGRYVLVRQAEGDAAMQLKDVTVTASRLGSNASEGSGSFITDSASSATGLTLSARETPQAVSVVTRQQIEEQNLNSVTEVLEQTPGMIVNTTGPAGSDANSIYVRGFELKSIQVDGINRSTTYGFTEELADMVSYDRVEVVRGATGLMSGVGDPGATVNLIRKKPTRETQRSLTLKAGSWDNYRTELDLSGSLVDSGELRGRVVTAWSDDQSHIDRQSQEQQVVYGVLEWDLDDSTLLTVGSEYRNLDSDQAGNHGFPMYRSDGSLFEPSRSFNSASDWSYHKRESTTVFATLEHALNERWTLKLNAEHNRRSYDDSFATAASGRVNADGSGISTWSGRWAGKPRQTSFDLSLAGSFSLLGRDHQLYLGASHSKAYYRNDGYPLWTIQSIDNIFTWNGSLQVPAAIYTKSSESALDEQQTAWLASVRWSLSDRLSLITGARVIDWSRDEWTRTLATGDVNRTALQENGVFTPYVGLVYDLNDNWSAYAGYTTIFNPQDKLDSTGTYLAPEEGVNYELGLKAEFFDQRLNTGLSVFEVRQDNLAVADGSVLAPNGDQAYRAESGTKTRGFEVEAAGELLPDWQVSASYTYAVIEDADGDRLNTQMPRDTFKLYTSYRLQSLPQLKVGGGVRWQGAEYYKNSGPNGETAQQDSYSVADLMASYDINAATTVSLNLNNVFDETYYTNIGSRGWYGTPRNFTATLRHNF